MTIGLLGKKCGMTRIFTESGESIPVVVLEILPNKITQIKTEETDGYSAIQVTMGERRVSRMTKPLLGHYAKAGVSPGLGLWEFRLEEGDSKEELAVGSELTVGRFQEGQLIDVQGVSKGKGFAGVIKRHHFSRQDETHGNSLSHRAPGSIGQRQTPGRVFKGKKMAGHLGNKVCTISKQEIIKIDKDKNLLMIKGVVPGAPGGVIVILPTAKSKKRSKGE